jgi:uncharacterized OB-fold protein
VGDNKARVPVVEGWFTMDEERPQLLGSRCSSCGARFFPKASACRNPECGRGELEEVPLSRTGRVWSFTDNRYPPPPPYIAPDPFEPYAIAAVELADERMVVLGQIVPGTDVAGLDLGTEMEVALGTLYEDEEHEYVVWKWRPTGA